MALIYVLIAKIYILPLPYYFSLSLGKPSTSTQPTSSIAPTISTLSTIAGSTTATTTAISATAKTSTTAKSSTSTTITSTISTAAKSTTTVTKTNPSPSKESKPTAIAILPFIKDGSSSIRAQSKVSHSLKLSIIPSLTVTSDSNKVDDREKLVVITSSKPSRGGWL